MAFSLALLLLGLALRLPDRWHFARARPRNAALHQLMTLQRSRANNWTPALLLVGQWTQIVGWWGVAATGGPLAAVPASLAVAVHLRHLQEISHFAVHGVLTRSHRFGDVLADYVVHRPLALAPISVRRSRHVRDHHPNATVAGADPNLTDLQEAGLRPGTSRWRFRASLLYPLTGRGVRATVKTMAAAVVTAPSPRSRSTATAAVAAVPVAAYLAGGWSAVLFGVLVPRILLYPQLAWLSLLVEHTWFDPQPRTGTPARVEAGRCLRLYPHNRVLSAVASATWLPYGDLHHYAHSAHPAVRWNYLLPLERHLGHPDFTPAALLLGTPSVAQRHRRALISASSADTQYASGDTAFAGSVQRSVMAVPENGHPVLAVGRTRSP